MKSLGLFIDGTKADWSQFPGEQTAVQRLAMRYVGTKEYMGGPGTDERGPFRKVWESLMGAGRASRFEEMREKLWLHRPEVVDLFGWSRGGDEVILFSYVSVKMGYRVRFLGAFDPVPARGIHGINRILPMIPVQKVYERPPADVVCQVLATEEHRKILRHAVIDKADVTRYVAGVHGDAGRSARAETLMADAALAAGVEL